MKKFHAHLFIINRERWTILKLITLNIPENYLKYLDELVDGNYYPNRAEAIRIAVRDMLISEVWERRRMNEEIEIRVE